MTADAVDHSQYEGLMPKPNGPKKKPASVQPPDTEEEIWAKRNARAAKRRAEYQELNDKMQHGSQEPTELGFKPRQFVGWEAALKGRSFKVLSWNILAQALVKRDLFPGSDCLKWSVRGPVLMREVLHYSPDIACLQEVDRIADHKPPLEKAGYETRWETGYYDKLHGLLIAWKKSVFKKEAEHVALMDDLAFSAEPDKPDGQKGKKRTGLTRVTRNVGLALALSFVDDPKRGVIVATHHLFWHARFSHERARQTGLWLRDLREFRRSRPEWKSWPLIFTGDFNTQPYEPCYRLLMGQPLLPRHHAMLNHSRVLHFTADNLNRDQVSFDPFNKAPVEEDEGEGEGEHTPYADEVGDEDQALKRCRQPRPSDGLLSDDELISLYAEEKTGKPLALESAYGSHYGRLRQEHGVECFDGRPPDEGVDASLYDGQVGANEPRWTSVTPLWRCTLDYLLTLPGEAGNSPKIEVSGLLPLHKTIDCEPGLPRKDVCASDHMALMAEYVLEA